MADAVHRFERHACRERPVADDRDDVVVITLDVARDGHSLRGRDGSPGVPCPELVVLGLGACEEARDPAELPITIFRVPEDLTQLRFCEEIGIDRIVFSLPAENADAVMPILDRWSAIKRQLEG